MSITTTRTEHVNAINDHIQQGRLDTGQLDEGTLTPVADSWVMVGDVVATRRNDRRLRTSVGEPVRNRERWIVSATDSIEEGDVTVTRLDGHGTITLPRDYVREHVQLAHTTTEPGAQGDTSTCSVTLATTATTRRGLYMAMTRGEREDLALVVTQSQTDRLIRAEELATPTRLRVNELRNVIDDHHRMGSTRRMFDDFNDLEGVAHDAGRMCHALDQWKHWANGRNLDNAALAEIAAALRDHDDRPGISQLAAPLAQWARRRGLELQPPTRPTPSRSSMGIEIGF